MTENKNNLPELQNAINAELAKQEKETNEFLCKLQSFAKLINREPEPGKLKEHPIVKGVFYLPISFMEMTLDRFFFGMWETLNFHWQIVANEIVASIDLRVFNPISKTWITRAGAAATKVMTDAIPKDQYEHMTQQERNRWALNLDNKKPGALENGGFAKLKAECFKNACLSLGKYFGRDENREHTDNLNPLVVSMDTECVNLRENLSALISECKDEQLRLKIIDEVLEGEAKKINTPDFYKSLISKIC